MNSGSKYSFFFTATLLIGLMTAAIPVLTAGGFVAAQTYGQSWATPTNITLLNTSSSIGLSGPVMAVDSAGNLHMVYAGQSDNGAGCWELYYGNNIGGSWSWANISKANISGYNVLNPSMAIDHNGVIHVVWAAGISLGYDIFYTNNSGGTWKTPLNISKSYDTIEPSAAIVVDSSNILHICYVSFFGLTGAGLYYLNFSASTGWSTPVNITSPLGVLDSISWRFAMDIAPDNTIYVAFSPYNGTLPHSEIFLVNNTGGLWGVPVNVSKNEATTQLTDKNPAMSIDSAGSIHLVWEQIDTLIYGLVYCIYTDTGLNNFQYLNTTTNVLRYASIITDVNNAVHIAYSQRNTTLGDYDVYYLNNVNGTFTAPLNITPNEESDEVSPQILIDTQGFAHIVFNNGTCGSFIQYTHSTEPVVANTIMLPLIIISVTVVVVIVAAGAWYIVKVRGAST